MVLVVFDPAVVSYDEDRLEEIYHGVLALHPIGVVTERRFVTRAEMEGLRFKPSSLAHVAWGRGFGYDPLELIQL